MLKKTQWKEMPWKKMGQKKTKNIMIKDNYRKNPFQIQIIWTQYRVQFNKKIQFQTVKKDIQVLLQKIKKKTICQGFL